MTFHDQLRAMICITIVALSLPADVFAQPGQQELRREDIKDKPVVFYSEAGESGEFTWWLPAGARE